MDKFTKDDLRQLSEYRQWPSVSIYMPMHPAGGSQQNPIRFKNMIKKAQGLLADYGYDKSGSFFQPAEKIYNDDSYWKKRSNGIAMFISPEIFKIYRLPSEFDELFVITRRFHLKPIIPVISGNAKFFVLAASQNRVRLLQCSRDSVEELDVADLPKNIEETLKYDHPRRQLQFHTGAKEGGTGDRPAMFHGQGTGIDEQDENLKRFVHDINKAVEDTLKEESAPLVFAGVDELFATFKEICGYKNLYEKAVQGNPDEQRAEQLKDKAWSLVEAIVEKEEKEARKRYQELSHTSSANWELTEIVPAAYFGRVDSLFVAKGVQQWGSFDADKNQVMRHGEKEAEDEDLLDFCAVHTLANGGKVFVSEPSEVPDQGLLAAIFRY